MNPVDALSDVESRLHTACLTDAVQKGDGPRGFFSTWPAYRHTWWDSGNELSKLTEADIARRLISAPRFVPTGRQIDECLPTLALMDGIPSAERDVVYLRAHQLWYGFRGGWRRIGRDLGVSHSVAISRHYNITLYAFERSLRRSQMCSGQPSKISRVGLKRAS